jgi:predicted Zn-dependent peptidase
MKYLSIDQARLDVQKNVVVEEFKQRYLNVPYGDAWLKLRPLAYQTHPYRWPTIGMKIEHIQEATLSDVQSFYDHFYSPDNAVITIAGNVDRNKVVDDIEKWFGSFAGHFNDRADLPKEGIQTSPRFEEIKANVPMDAIYKVYHMPARGSKEYVVADLVGDLLGRGQSSRLYRHLVRERQIFNNINAYITGSADPGLLVITGKLNPGHNFNVAENAIQDEIAKMIVNPSTEEVEKVINQATSSMYFSETELLNKAIALSIANSLGNTDLVNLEMDWIREASKEDLIQGARQILVPQNACTLHYRSSK